MTSPYTLQPLDAFMAAQASVGMALTAALWFRPLRPLVAGLLLLLAVWIAILLPVGRDLFVGLGMATEPLFVQEGLRASAACALGAALVSRKTPLIAVAAVGAACMWWLTGYLRNSDLELAATHLLFFGLLVGVAWRCDQKPHAPSGDASPEGDRRGPPEQGPPAHHDDVVFFVVASGLAAVVSALVLGRYTNSGDEVANTYQAAVFAKLHAYAKAPQCAEAFRTFWVFQADGRLFSQYTPGWPLFMAPFVAIRAPWLAGPVSLGLLVVAVARLARRAALEDTRDGAAVPARVARACGLGAAIATTLASTILINGGSRYPHVFVAAMYAWALEALCEMSGERRGSRPWGLLLGAASALLLAARPGDGATLGVGLFVYFVYACARQRIGLRATSEAVLAFACLAGLTLVILRLQLGRWLTTGYALAETLYPWAKPTFSAPGPDEWRWGIPLATGSYCWWPCSPALGLAGLATLRGRARRVPFVLFLSFVPFLAMYSFNALGRGFDLGYGPRYSLPVIVPMAVGTGVILGRIFGVAWERPPTALAFAAHGPAALALVAVVLGVVRIAPLVYPYNYADVHNHNRFRMALERAHLHDAIVFVGNGLVNTDPMDLTENLPLDLYPDQDVLVALLRSDDLTRCVRGQYPSRHYFRAVPGDEIHLVPF